MIAMALRYHRFRRACALAAAIAVAATGSTLDAVAQSESRPARDESILALPGESQGFAIVVTKHARKLDLFRHGELVRSFQVVLGSRPEGPKRYEGDFRTPEGAYRVIAKRLHERWRYFIEIDYPNPTDRLVYEAEASAGRIPLFAQRLPGPGGSIGIHGSDRPADQAAGRDWTKGCVAMANDDIEILYEAVAVGTPVLVVP